MNDTAICESYLDGARCILPPHRGAHRVAFSVVEGIPEDLAKVLARVMNEAEVARDEYLRARRWNRISTGFLILAVLANVAAATGRALGV